MLPPSLRLGDRFRRWVPLDEALATDTPRIARDGGRRRSRGDASCERVRRIRGGLATCRGPHVHPRQGHRAVPQEALLFVSRQRQGQGGPLVRQVQGRQVRLSGSQDLGQRPGNARIGRDASQRPDQAGARRERGRRQVDPQSVRGLRSQRQAERRPGHDPAPEPNRVQQHDPRSRRRRLQAGRGLSCRRRRLRIRQHRRRPVGVAAAPGKVPLRRRDDSRPDDRDRRSAEGVAAENRRHSRQVPELGHADGRSRCLRRGGLRDPLPGRRRPGRRRARQGEADGGARAGRGIRGQGPGRQVDEPGSESADEPGDGPRDAHLAQSDGES